MKCLIPQDSSRTGRKRTKRWLIGAFCLLGAVQSACGPISGLNSGGTSRYQIPFPDEAGTYALREVDIPGFTDPESLRGIYAEILVDPFEANGVIQSTKPVGRFLRTANGLMIATNYVSRVATAIHAHAERLYQLDQSAGVQQNLISWPLKIGIEANVVNTKDQSVMRNNALFDRRLNALLLVPYFNAFVPIGMNGGILAHEHFHRIFERVVLAKLPTLRKTETGSVAEFNDTVLRAMNEGFADFWAWVYTGDPDFIQPSLPNEQVRRSLKVPSSELPDRDHVRMQLDQISLRDLARREKGRVSIAYESGTLYARLMRDLTMAQFGLERADRIRGAQLVIRILPALFEDARRATERGERLDPLAILGPLKLAVKVSPMTCKIFERASGLTDQCR